MADAEYAARKYREGIEKIGGASAYIECGKRKTEGFLAVADCLHEKKVTSLTTDVMVQRYKNAA